MNYEQVKIKERISAPRARHVADFCPRDGVLRGGHENIYIHEQEMHKRRIIKNRIMAFDAKKGKKKLRERIRYTGIGGGQNKTSIINWIIWKITLCPSVLRVYNNTKDTPLASVAIFSFLRLLFLCEAHKTRPQNVSWMLFRCFCFLPREWLPASFQSWPVVFQETEIQIFNIRYPIRILSPTIFPRALIQLICTNKRDRGAINFLFPPRLPMISGI